jgi:hypothetical protein
MKYLLYCIRICARTNLQVFPGLWNPRSQTIEAILQLHILAAFLDKEVRISMKRGGCRQKFVYTPRMKSLNVHLKMRSLYR